MYNPYIKEKNMKKTIFLLAAFLLPYVWSAAAEKDERQYTILLTGASFASPNNGWFELGCRKLNAVPVNRAVGGESIASAANRMYQGTLFTKEEMEILDTVCSRFGSSSSREISRMSHDEHAWQDYYQHPGTIPFEAAFRLKSI